MVNGNIKVVGEWETIRRIPECGAWSKGSHFGIFQLFLNNSRFLTKSLNTKLEEKTTMKKVEDVENIDYLFPEDPNKLVDRHRIVISKQRVPECKSGGNERSPRKPANQWHSPGRFPLMKIRQWLVRGLNPKVKREEWNTIEESALHVKRQPRRDITCFIKSYTTIHIARNYNKRNYTSVIAVDGSDLLADVSGNVSLEFLNGDEPTSPGPVGWRATDLGCGWLWVRIPGKAWVMDQRWLTGDVKIWRPGGSGSDLRYPCTKVGQTRLLTSIVDPHCPGSPIILCPRSARYPS
ncbi:hypothetical protein PR048_005210 [Dryococelus australis]|uniref:Uncharacterized protein n=1 Tax=Dryococelus australis TaxID=614101 RepID=A0ABQ9I8M2_9NEOP|nr:hypothetical protein PR048_005210 [Dryococelus australis]